jgi:hypothetical protein
MMRFAFDADISYLDKKIFSEAVLNRRINIILK